MQLSQQDLLQGMHLQNPLVAFNYDMEKWQMIKQPGIPLPHKYSCATDELETKPNNMPKYPHEPHGNGDGTQKKHSNQVKPIWKDNSTYDTFIYSLKQTCTRHMGK